MRFLKISIITVLLCITQNIFSQNFKFGKVSVDELKQTEHQLDPSANAAILYREYETRFEYAEHEGFFIITEVFERIKIYKKEGFDWANKTIGLYQGAGSSREEISSLKGYTYFLEGSKIQEVKLKKDGIFDEKLNKYYKIKKFTMPNIKEGSVIEYKYTIKTPFVSNIDAYRFQETIPVNSVKLNYSTPEYFNYKTHQKGWIPIEIKKDAKERQMQYRYTSAPTSMSVTYKTHTSEVNFRENIYNVNLNNVPALKEEAYAGNIENYMSSLKFELAYTKFPNSVGENYATSWEAVSESIYKSEAFGSELKKENYFSKDIDNLISGVSNENEKTMLIFNYIKTKMNWDTYRGIYTDKGVKSAYKEGVGNMAEINLMLTAMLRYARINANPILISTKNNGIPVFPTRHGFNAVISGVELNNHVLLLDASNNDSEIDILDPKLMNWKGRIIRKDGSSTWVSLIPSTAASISTMIKSAIGPDFNVSGSAQSRYTGHFTNEMRSTYALLNEDDQRKELEMEMGETELSNIQFENLKTLYKPVTLKYDFETTDRVEEIGGKLYITPLLFLTTKESPFTLETRNYPVDFKFPRKIRNIINIEIPEGYEVESIPETVNFGFGQKLGSFRFQISNTGNKIQLSTELSINNPVIDSSEYENLKGFYQLFIEKENEKVVLKKIE